MYFLLISIVDINYVFKIQTLLKVLLKMTPWLLVSRKSGTRFQTNAGTKSDLNLRFVVDWGYGEGGGGDGDGGGDKGGGDSGDVDNGGDG